MTLFTRTALIWMVKPKGNKNLAFRKKTVLSKDWQSGKSVGDAHITPAKWLVTNLFEYMWKFRTRIMSWKTHRNDLYSVIWCCNCSRGHLRIMSLKRAPELNTALHLALKSRAVWGSYQSACLRFGKYLATVIANCARRMEIYMRFFEFWKILNPLCVRWLVNQVLYTRDAMLESWLVLLLFWKG